MSTSKSLVSPEEVVRAYYADISQGRFDEAAARLSPDSTLWILGEGHWPLGGHHDLSSLRKIHATVAERFPDGLKVTVKGMTVEGERVAVEAQSLGTRIDGKIYHNSYHYLIIVRDGLIRERREYLDTIHAREMLCDPLSN
ncbi:MAG: nuclear transport factor 2 family protein [Halioglobus sp.]|nr:nuclear transport factor 2 family protein [Halioglobus sp.]MDG2326536.1 nuclear transport factor 2 family protein [Halioglobus sp.]